MDVLELLATLGIGLSAVCFAAGLLALIDDSPPFHVPLENRPGGAVNAPGPESKESSLDRNEG